MTDSTMCSFAEYMSPGYLPTCTFSDNPLADVKFFGTPVLDSGNMVRSYVLANVIGAGAYVLYNSIVLDYSMENLGESLSNLFYYGGIYTFAFGVGATTFSNDIGATLAVINGTAVMTDHLYQKAKSLLFTAPVVAPVVAPAQEPGQEEFGQIVQIDGGPNEVIVPQRYQYR